MVIYNGDIAGWKKEGIEVDWRRRGVEVDRGDRSG
jgi:hypothetical protein